MTDPKTRRPEFWRAFGWVMAVGSAVMLAAGIAVVAIGGRTGWLNMGLGVVFAIQSAGYFRQYVLGKRERDSRE